jgi:hypothetical protein
MVTFNRLREYLHKSSAKHHHGKSPDTTAEIAPVPIEAEPVAISAAGERIEPDFPPVTPTGDTQQMDNQVIAEQLEGLRKTLEADAFEERKPDESNILPFGNHPPTVEMDRPELN